MNPEASKLSLNILFRINTSKLRVPIMGFLTLYSVPMQEKRKRDAAEARKAFVSSNLRPEVRWIKMLDNLICFF